MTLKYPCLSSVTVDKRVVAIDVRLLQTLLRLGSLDFKVDLPFQVRLVLLKQGGVLKLERAVRQTQMD